MEQVYDRLAHTAVAALAALGGYRIVVLVAGGPGSGKSTLAAAVAARINQLDVPEITRGDGSNGAGGMAAAAVAEGGVVEGDGVRMVGAGGQATSVVVCPGSGGDLAAVVPMDGFHLPRAVLDTMEDAATAHARRGAPFTFDGLLVVSLVRVLVAGCGAPLDRSVVVPTFDHALKDPTPGGCTVGPATRIVLVEGLYLLLDMAPWNAIPRTPPVYTWLIAGDRGQFRERVARRHVAAGLAPTLLLGYARYDENDGPNGHLVGSTADVVVQSIDV